MKFIQCILKRFTRDPILVGQKFVNRDKEGNPFDMDHVLVTGVQDGFIQYKYYFQEYSGYTPRFYSMKQGSFRWIFKLIK